MPRSSRPRRRAPGARSSSTAAPDPGVVAVQLATQLHRSGQIQLATEVLSSAIARGQIHSKLLNHCAELACRLGLVPDLLRHAPPLPSDDEGQRGLIQLARAATTVGLNAEAAAILRALAAARPDDLFVAGMLGVALANNNENEEALRVLTDACNRDPTNFQAQHALGQVMLRREDSDGALAALKIAVALKPTDARARVDLGRAFIEKGLFEEAFLMIQSGLDDESTKAHAYVALGELYKAYGNIDRIIHYYRLALEAKSTDLPCSPYLFHLLANDRLSTAEVFAEHVRLGGTFDTPEGLTRRHRNTPDPGRRIKVGFVSGDFFNHSTARFVLPLFDRLDRERFEIYGIYTNDKFDHATELIRARMDHWRPCVGHSDRALANWIEGERIDILIDLSGHTAENRLSAFGLKPAPVQVTYLGYPGTTGMRTMDYRITSEAYDPTGPAELIHTERLIRLPGVVAPFQALVDVEVSGLPCLAGAPFTFACLLPPWRFTAGVFDVWSRILSAMPHSRLLIGNATRDMTARYVVCALAERGIAQDQLMLTPRLKLKDYLRLHHKIDLALDTFPYNGGTTSAYSLWMGVPFITLEGDRTAARTGMLVAKEAGLDDFVARDQDDYVRLALHWAQRPQELAELRRTMRARLRISNEKDQALFAQQFGDALVEMWRTWCAEENERRRQAS